jgi:hypothetical protein
MPLGRSRNTRWDCGNNIDSINESRESKTDASKYVALEVNAVKTKYVSLFRH